MFNDVEQSQDKHYCTEMDGRLLVKITRED